MKILITGAAGFIGSAFVRAALAAGHEVVSFDALTYAGGEDNLPSDPRHVLVRGDVADAGAVRAALQAHRPDWIAHLAAESHVDRSIDGPAAFVRTNLVGTAVLLEAARAYWADLEPDARGRFRFLHVSTDEVFGALGPDGVFTADSAYAPTSPYAATKAGSDHLARAYGQTYGLPVIITNCSNNYGPRQFPEKLIPVVILKALACQPIPLYGDGRQVRDWLYVDDHAAGLLAALQRGHPGQTYLFGGRCEMTNAALVERLCALLDQMRPRQDGVRYAAQITPVTDRPAHDFRYAIDPSGSESALDWRAETAFDAGLKATLAWYLANPDWVVRRLGEHAVPERLGLAVVPHGQTQP